MKYYFNYYKALLKATLKPSKPFYDNRYQNIGIINPCVASTNLGDWIIYDAVYSALRKNFENAFITDFPSQIHTGYDARALMGKMDKLFVSGTNLLSSNMDTYYQWKISAAHKKPLRKKVLLTGVGWWQYQDKPNSYTRNLLNTVLDDRHIHSVRDSYTLEMLKSAGITNVVNTTCPTLWNVSPEHCTKIKKTQSADVITTLTFYNKKTGKDAELLNLLEKNYRNVYIWIQGMADLKYLEEIYPHGKKIKIVPPTIEAYNNLLESNDDIDYVGTRLHAGIRAIQKKRRTIILAVDNRAIEIGKDTGLNVIKREDLDKANEFITKDYSTNIILPAENILKWKNSLIDINSK